MVLNNQRGSILIFTLLLLGFTTTICFALHSITCMEFKMSLYEHRANQARELAESASLLALEELNIILRDDYFNIQEFPATIALDNCWTPVLDEDKIMQTSIITLNKQNEDFCAYSFKTSGIYKGAKKTIDVKVVFDFIEFFSLQSDINGNLQIVFSHREFLDRGRFIAFKEVE